MLGSSLSLTLRATRSGPACGCPNSFQMNLSLRRQEAEANIALAMARRAKGGTPAVNPGGFVHAPAPAETKKAPCGALFVSGGEGGIARLIPEPHPPRYALRASLRLSKFVPTLRRQDAGANIAKAMAQRERTGTGPNQLVEPGGFVHAPAPTETKKAPCGALFVSGGEGGIARLIPEPHPPRYALRASLRLSKFVPTNLSNRVASSTHPHQQKQKKPLAGLFLFLAERVGFEPTVRYKRTPDFESGTFDHSATSPEVGRE